MVPVLAGGDSGELLENSGKVGHIQKAHHLRDVRQAKGRIFHEFLGFLKCHDGWKPQVYVAFFSRLVALDVSNDSLADVFFL